MKKLLFPLLTVLLFTACKKEIVTDKAQEEITSAPGANKTSQPWRKYAVMLCADGHLCLAIGNGIFIHEPQV